MYKITIYSNTVSVDIDQFLNIHMLYSPKGINFTPKEIYNITMLNTFDIPNSNISKKIINLQNLQYFSNTAVLYGDNSNIACGNYSILEIMLANLNLKYIEYGYFTKSVIGNTKFYPSSIIINKYYYSPT